MCVEIQRILAAHRVSAATFPLQSADRGIRLGFLARPETRNSTISLCSQAAATRNSFALMTYGQLLHVDRGCRALTEFSAKPASAMIRTTACAMVVSADGYIPSTSMLSLIHI